MYDSAPREQKGEKYTQLCVGQQIIAKKERFVMLSNALLCMPKLGH